MQATTATTRDKFVERFGEADAARLESAARRHRKESGSNVYSSMCEMIAGRQKDEAPDQFLLDIATCISWECVSRFREWHEFAASEEDLRSWIKANAVPPEEYRDPAGELRYAEYLS